MSRVFLEVGEKFLPSPSVEFCGGFHTGLSRIPRVAWISGSEPPPAVRTPITPVWQVKIPCLSTVKPCGGFALHFYTAAKGFGPFYSVTMVDDLSVTRCGFQRSRCVGFWGHGASPCAQGIGFPLPLCLYYSTGSALCQDFFNFFC